MTFIIMTCMNIFMINTINDDTIYSGDYDEWLEDFYE